MIRPKEFAVLLLGSGDTAPRQRARDQQADAVGLELKRKVLAAVVARDPDPSDLEAALVEIVDDLGPPAGPTRAVALGVLDEWRFAAGAPDWVPHLVGEAVGGAERRGGRRGGNLPA